MAICSICKKRHAIVFTSRYENGNRIDEGFCLKCAYESGISGVTDMFKATGINADNIDEMSDKLEQLVSQNGFSADPTDFLKSLASGDEFGGLSYDGDDDDETYEFDEDSTPVSIADSDEPKDDKQGEDEEKEPGNFFDSLFGRRPGSQAGDDAQGKDSKDPRKARGKARLKYLNEFGTNLTERAAQGKIDRIIGRDKEIERCIQIQGTSSSRTLSR